MEFQSPQNRSRGEAGRCGGFSIRMGEGRGQGDTAGE